MSDRCVCGHTKVMHISPPSVRPPVAGCCLICCFADDPNGCVKFKACACSVDPPPPGFQCCLCGRVGSEIT